MSEVYICSIKDSYIDKVYTDRDSVKQWATFMIEVRGFDKESLKVEKHPVKGLTIEIEEKKEVPIKDFPSVYELQQYWLEKCDDILADSNISSKSKFYDFRDAYESYLFYGGRGYANEDIEMDALDEALNAGLSGEWLNLEEQLTKSDIKTLKAVIREMHLDLIEQRENIDKLETRLRLSRDNKRRLEITLEKLIDEEEM